MWPKSGSFAGIAVLSALFLILSSGLAVADYPKLQYYVTDQVGVLTASNVSDIEDVCIEVQQKRGAEMAVLILNSTAPDSIDTYAVKTFERSALGQKGKDNGVLLIVATGDRTWRVEVGYGLEGVLPDSFVGHIADEYLVPYLNASDYYDGILYTTAFLGQEIITNYTAGSPQKAAPAHYPISWLPCTAWELVLVVLVIALVVGTRGRVLWWLPWLLIGRGRGGGGGGGSGGRSGGGGASGKW